jgi:hypothetical protein
MPPPGPLDEDKEEENGWKRKKIFLLLPPLFVGPKNGKNSQKPGKNRAKNRIL